MNQPSIRRFGAMDQVDKSLFEHSFTTEMNFQSSFEKIKCFRIMDENGDIVKKGYDTTLSNEEILKMYDAMVTMNEVD